MSATHRKRTPITADPPMAVVRLIRASLGQRRIVGRNLPWSRMTVDQRDLALDVLNGRERASA